MTIQPIPEFNKSKTVQEVRQQFLSRVTPDMDAATKAALTAEFQQAVNEACAKAEKEVAQQTKVVAASNVQTFLASPSTIINDLQREYGRSFELGEILQWKGIATVTSKRNGKGFEIGKGSDFRHTISQFLVTAVIGHYRLTVESGCYNGKEEKRRMHACAAAQLARSIAAKII